MCYSKQWWWNGCGGQWTRLSFPFSHILTLFLQVFQEARKLKAAERQKERRKWQERARAAKEKQAQSEGTPV